MTTEQPNDRREHKRVKAVVKPAKGERAQPRLKRDEPKAAKKAAKK
jgi:hypothetical protein